LSHFPLNIKNTNKFHFATLAFYLLKTFFSFKTNKKHKNKSIGLSTPNYEVLILYGYVGKGHFVLPNQKNVKKTIFLFFLIITPIPSLKENKL